MQKLRQAEGADSEEDMDQTSSNVRQRKNVSSTDRQMEEAGDGEINEEMEVDTWEWACAFLWRNLECEHVVVMSFWIQTPGWWCLEHVLTLSTQIWNNGW